MNRRPPPLQSQLDLVKANLAKVNQQMRSKWLAASTEPIEAIKASIEKQSQAAVQMYLRAMARKR